MKNKIAIFTPQIGGLSETFIQRHTKLLPGKMVVITHEDSGVYSGHWKTDCPTLVINNVGQVQKTIKNALNRLGINYDVYMLVLKDFLIKHNVGYALGEYLDYSLQWIDICSSLKIPFYAHSHGYDISSYLKTPDAIKNYQKLKNCAGIINVGKFGKERLEKIGLGNANIYTIPCCPIIPTSFIERSNSKIVKCLSSGRMTGKKSPVLTIESFRRALIDFPNMHLDYIGAGEQLGAAIDFVRAFNLQDKVLFHGAQSNEVVLEFMEKADIFISHNVVDSVTADEEGLPVTILEAMGKGLPVVSTYHAGIPDCINDGENGFLVKEGNVDEMANKIKALGIDKDLRRRIGYNAWRRALNEFSWEEEKIKLLKVICNYD